LHLPRKRGKNKTWTKEENKQIISMYTKHKSIKDMAAALSRSESSVRLQANRKLGLFRSDRHLQREFRSKNFYNSLKKTITFGTSGSVCCLCKYSKYIELHHLDGNGQNHAIHNISSLCPNHHIEVEHGEHGEHADKELFCVWWRIYSDGSRTEKFNNKTEIKERIRNAQR